MCKYFSVMLQISTYFFEKYIYEIKGNLVHDEFRVEYLI